MALRFWTSELEYKKSISTYYLIWLDWSVKWRWCLFFVRWRRVRVRTFGFWVHEGLGKQSTCIILLLNKLLKICSMLGRKWVLKARTLEDLNVDFIPQPQYSCPFSKSQFIRKMPKWSNNENLLSTFWVLCVEAVGIGRAADHLKCLSPGPSPSPKWISQCFLYLTFL